MCHCIRAIKSEAYGCAECSAKRGAPRWSFLLWLVVVVAVLAVSGCAGAGDVSQTLGGPLDFETRDHRIARVSDTVKGLHTEGRKAPVQETPEQIQAKWDASVEEGKRTTRAIPCSEAYTLGQNLVCAGVLDSVWE